MTILFETCESTSPYIETITHGHTVQNGAPARPAETNWHMVFVRYQGTARLLVVGPLTTAGIATYAAGAEILWIKFKLGTFMPHLPLKTFLDSETPLPDAGSRSFWLNGCAWQYPDVENVETFISRLARDEVLAHDPLVDSLLQGRPPDVSPRTVRHRFTQATGQSQVHIRQFQRAQQAADLLCQGAPILDVVDQLGYFDQPHLTRSLKRFIGVTPAQQLSGVGQGE